MFLCAVSELLYPLPPVLGDQVVNRLHFAFEQVAFHEILLRERREHRGIVFVEADAVHSLCRHCEPFVRAAGVKMLSRTKVNPSFTAATA